MRACRRQ